MRISVRALARASETANKALARASETATKKLAKQETDARPAHPAMVGRVAEQRRTAAYCWPEDHAEQLLTFGV
jgi:hypothetical protein